MYIEKDENKILNDIYEPLELFGVRVLFTSGRIDPKALPYHINRYEVRHDLYGDMCQLGHRIFIDHYGTILSYKTIPLDDGYRDINEAADVKYNTDPGITLKDYIKECTKKEKIHER